MHSRFVRAASVLIIAAMLICFGGACAYADSGNITVTVKSGDTIETICTAYGVSFKENRNLIMSLNGFTKEAELYALTAGMTLILPASATSSKYSAISDDKVKYYIIPYVICKGDSIAHVYWLWGLRFENYQEDIKALNYKDDLDVLFVGDTYLLPTSLNNVVTNTYTTVMTHTMKSGESVYDILKAYNIDYNKKSETLSRYNLGRDITKLKAGEELLIPLL